MQMQSYTITAVYRGARASGSSMRANKSPRLVLSSQAFWPSKVQLAPCRNRKCMEYGTTTYGRNRMSAESPHLPTFGTETETVIRSTFVWKEAMHLKWETKGECRWRFYGSLLHGPRN